MLIISAGMPRSGSTWLFNVIRLLLENANYSPPQFTSGWIDDIDLSDPNVLVKIHRYDENIIAKSDLIFYSYRDLRDAIASAYRKFNRIPSIDYAKFLVEQDEVWRSKATFTMRYEAMLDNPGLIIEEISKILGIKNPSTNILIEKVNTLNYDSYGEKNSTYNESNLYHHGHKTNGAYRSWEDGLDESLAKCIYLEFESWFKMHQYPQ